MRSKITVVGNVYFQKERSGVHQEEIGYTRRGHTDEQVYAREVLVRDETVPLESGWNQNPEMVGFRNLAKKGVDDKEDTNTLLLQISFDHGKSRHPLTLLRPGECFVISPFAAWFFVLKYDLSKCDPTIPLHIFSIPNLNTE